VGAGIALIAAGAFLGLLIVFGAWRRLPPPVALAALVGCGAMIGAGALLVQDGVSGLEWAITLGVLGVVSPLHAWLVFGPPGQGR
jgi:hypothetical protein